MADKKLVELGLLPDEEAYKAEYYTYLSLIHIFCGADAIDKVGNPYPDETHELCMRSDAVPVSYTHLDVYKRQD